MTAMNFSGSVVAMERMIIPNKTSEIPKASVMFIAALDKTKPARQMAKKPKSK